MEEGWWFRWIANNSQYIFWTVWGAGAGACGMMFSGAVAPPTGTIVYWSVLILVMGQALGFAASRASDHRSDARRRYRRLLIARFRLSEFGSAWLEYQAILSQATDGGKHDAVGTSVPAQLVGKTLYTVDMIRRSAESPPNFEDVIVDEKGIRIGARMASIFTFSAQHFKVEHIYSGDQDARRREAVRYLTVNSLETSKHTLEALRNAEEHFVTSAIELD